MNKLLINIHAILNITANLETSVSIIIICIIILLLLVLIFFTIRVEILSVCEKLNENCVLAFLDTFDFFVLMPFHFSFICYYYNLSINFFFLLLLFFSLTHSSCHLDLLTFSCRLLLRVLDNWDKTIKWWSESQLIFFDLIWFINKFSDVSSCSLMIFKIWRDNKT